MTSPLENGAAAEQDRFRVTPPSVSLPKGGGAVRGIGEKFAANPVTGTGSMSVPLALSPGRGGFGPQLAVTYDSGAGNGPFGLGWGLSLPSISRKTDKGLPRYRDEEESDVFLLLGAEDLVPVVGRSMGAEPVESVALAGTRYTVRRYRPRIEGLFARIERWSEDDATENTFWRTISRDNVTTWYGRDANSRISDPADPRRIFQWLICQTHDDRGNVSVYSYVRDGGEYPDAAALWEANRSPGARRANRYLKSIRYGNVEPFLPKLGPVAPDPLPSRWLFEAVFDYGDHSGDFPQPTADPTPAPSPWLNRSDAFSSHRAGFDVRTYRLCRRVLMFHHFPDDPDVGADCLVRSTEFEYPMASALDAPLSPGYTTLRSVTHRSYQRDARGSATYHHRDLPPVSFTYSQPSVDPTVHTIDVAQLENLPVGTQGPGYRWIDLDGDGLSGVLSENAGGWYYKSNLGDGRFGPIRAVTPQPAVALTASGRHQFMDLAGDGSIDVVDFEGPTPGFYERDAIDGWKRHVPFASLPNIDWQDRNLRFVDLTGDGHADALITEHEVFTWYPSLDERGFDAAEHTRQPTDEDAGPRVVFADGTQTVFLADMCGDGLTDLVRIRSGDVCYWPNLGYGRFGRKVTFANAPRFDHPDLFDPSRIRLTDLDGSGPIDIIYLGRDGARLYFNRSGNSLSDALTVNLPVATESLGAVQVADLLGNGTACLVWNSHLPADANRPVCYIDLMGGLREREIVQDRQEQRTHEKPHLLIAVDNHLGGTSEIEYAPSTRFYLQDQAAGTPWGTRLPFPVHCVSKVTVNDRWRRTSFSSSYSYHHGFFDGVEREFRGFGRVEQWDTQTFFEVAAANADSPFVTQDQTLYQPPVKTVTWFHTGIAADRQRILGLYEQEYLPARRAAAFSRAGFTEPVLPQPEIDRGTGPEMDGDEWREAMRACKGMPLRQEVYELDLRALEEEGRHQPVRLFSAAQHNCHIRRLQPRGANRHAVFMALEGEACTCHYELELTAADLEIDPRIAHTLNLTFDEYGHPMQSVAVVYPRRATFDDRSLNPSQLGLVRAVQAERHIAYTEARFTNELSSSLRHHRPPVPCEVQTFELTGDDPSTGFRPGAGSYFSRSDFRAFALSATVPSQGPRTVRRLEYHEQPADRSAHMRLVEHARTRYWDDAGDAAPPSDALPFGQHGPRGLKYEDYKLALTDRLLGAVFGDKLEWEVESGITARGHFNRPIEPNSPFLKSGYILGSGIDAALSGQYWMRSGTAGFAADAHEHFFLPEHFKDPFGNQTTLAYDRLDLYIQSSRDALGNTSGVEAFDHRVLAPTRLRDPNENLSAVAFDIRGLPVASALLGKVDAMATESGDTLDGLPFDRLNPSAADVTTFFEAQTLDDVQARTWLGRATARFVYHFGEERDAAGLVVRWGATAPGACSLAREQHERDAPNDHPELGGAGIRLRVAFEYSDGGGQAFVKKVQAEPANDGGPLRWLTNGLTIVNNKGKPVLQYEPYFTGSDHRYQEPQAHGVSPVMYYDAPGRLVRTELPDGTLSRVEFSPWFSRSFDPSDTVLESRWYARRTRSNDSHEQRAARLAALHANTPAEAHFDALGREVVAIAHNCSPDPADSNRPLELRTWVHERYLTFTKLDAEGKPLWICDALGNRVMQYVTPPLPDHTLLYDEPARAQWHSAYDVPAAVSPCSDIAGNLVFQHSMDAGDRWMLTDAAGKPMLAWDVNDFRTDTGASTSQNRLFHTEYDALHRPTRQWLKINGDVLSLVEAFDYCDTGNPQGAMNPADARSRNLIGQAVRHWDPSGVATVERIDLSGQPSQVTRRLIGAGVHGNAAGVLDWSGDRLVLLDRDTFHQNSEHDALGRMTTLFNWHRESAPGASGRVAVYVPAYNERGLLVSEMLHVRAQKATVGDRTTFVANAQTTSAAAIARITYNEKGQKLTLALGNGTTTTYTYDDEMFRLTSIRTASTVPGRGFQDLHYTYDPVGNITHIRDAAQETIYRSNTVVRPEHEYVYDAIYRLIEGTGRENPHAPSPPSNREGRWPRGPIPTGDVPRNYTQRYVYDGVGNFLELRHRPDVGDGWTRRYDTQPDSNRLNRTWYGNNTAVAVTYHHDPHGNMLNLNQVAPPPADPEDDWGRAIRWDWRDMIRTFDAIGGGIARYHYGIDKQRTRKIINRLGGIVEDRIYLGGYELYRRHRGNPDDPDEEIESHHLFEGEQRVLLVDDVLTAKASAQPGPNGLTSSTQTLFRYQYGNHLGSAGLELDDTARVISYEEFHPYGTSAYRVMNSAIEVPAKRYRYTGMERDEECGLSYHAARYYLPSLAKWVSPDSGGLIEGTNRWAYAKLNPVKNSDTNGYLSDPTGRFMPPPVPMNAAVQTSARLSDATSPVPFFPLVSETNEGSPAAGWAMRPQMTRAEDPPNPPPPILCGYEHCGEQAAWNRYLGEQRYLDAYRWNIRKLLAEGSITANQYEMLRYNAGRGYVMDPSIFISLNRENMPEVWQQRAERLLRGFRADPRTIPPQFRVGKAGEIMANFSGANSPIGGPQILARGQFTLKDRSGKTALPDTGSRRGARKPDWPVKGEGLTVDTIEVKTPYGSAPEDPVDYVRSRPDVAQQLENERRIRLQGGITWGPMGGPQFTLSEGKGIGLTTGYWMWWPPTMIH